MVRLPRADILGGPTSERANDGPRGLLQSAGLRQFVRWPVPCTTTGSRWMVFIGIHSDGFHLHKTEAPAMPSNPDPT